jgi:hypothetical protein
MKYCPKCHTQLVADAKFCHNCGAKVEIALVACGHCQKKNPADAALCYSCVQPLGTYDLSAHREQPFLNLSFRREDILEDELKNLFFHLLKQTVEVIAPERYSRYLEQFYFSNFNRTVDLRARQLAAEYFEKANKQHPPSIVMMEKELENAIEAIVQTHLVLNCRDINPVLLPDGMLRHERTHRGTLRNVGVLRNMIFDYLDFQNERKKPVTDFIAMPEEKLKNASIRFLHAAMDEQVFFLWDDSLFGNNFREGFGMTEFGLYWKAPMDKPRRVYYHNIEHLTRQKDHITINGMYFHVNNAMDTKMLFLLAKLARIYGI